MSSPPTPLGTIGPYELRAELGQGGMGAVYRAYSHRHGREVALKLVRPGLVDVDDAARLVREGRLLSGLDHPFLVGFLDAGEHCGTPYLVMELVPGESLDRLLARDRCWEPERAVRLVRQLAEGAGELHRLGIVHRDLKPHNVLLDQRGSPQIADLGLARDDSLSRLTQTGVVLGTPAYMAPEQVQGQLASPASDVYALGVILFELLSGRLPFQETNQLALMQAQLEAAPPPLRSLRPDLGSDLAALVACCLAKDPGDRYPDGAALGAALAEVGFGSRSPAGRGAGRVAAVLTLALALGALASLLVGPSGPPAPGEAPPAADSGPAPSPELAALLADGDARLRRGDTGEAEAIYLAATERDPASAEAWAGYGRAASGEHRLGTARGRFERALRLDPHNTRALLGMALCCALTDRAAAEDYLRRAEASDPGSAYPALYRAQWLLNEDPAAAVPELERLAAAFPENTDVLTLLCGGLRVVGRAPESLRRAEEELARQDDPQLEAQRVYSLTAVGRPRAEVLAALESLRERYPGSLSVLSAGGDVILGWGDFERAAPWVAALRERFPQSPVSLEFYATLCLRRRWGLLRGLAAVEQAILEQPGELRLLKLALDLSEATRDFDRQVRYAGALLDEAPRDPELLRRLGQGAVGACEPRRAVEAFERLRALRPDDPWVTSSLWVQLASLEAFDRAEEVAAEALARAPSARQLSVYLHAARLGRGDLRSLEPLRELSRLGDRASLEANLVLLERCLQLGDLDGARACAQVLEDQGVEGPTSESLLGDEALARGRLHVAAERYETAFAFNPRCGEALLGLGEVYARAGGTAEARGLLELGVRLLERSGRFPSRLEPARARLRALDAAAGVELDAPLETCLAVGDAALEAYDQRTASLAFRAALSRSPTSGLAWAGLARVCGRRGFMRAAEALVRDALVHDPERPSTLVLASNLAQSAGRDEVAAELQARLETVDPQGPWTLYNRGELAWIQQDETRAQAAFQAAYARFPRERELVQGVAMFHLERGDFAEVQQIAEAYARATGTPALSLELAKALAGLEQPERALAAAHETLAWAPSHAAGLLLLGSLEDRRGERERAAEFFRRGLEQDPLQPLVRARLVAFAAEAGDAARALEEAALAWGVTPDALRLRVAVQLSDALLAAPSTVPAALDYAERACALEPSSAPARAQRGKVRRRLSDLEGALADFRFVLERDPTHTGALLVCGESALATLDRVGALELSERLLRVAPRDWRAQNLRGRVLLVFVGVEPAWESLLRAAELAPSVPEALFPVVDAGARLEKWATVRDYARRLLALEPPASETLRRLAEERLQRAREALGE
ncbi:MAG: protein kinase [Planctomycetota bacterium]